MAWFGRRQGPEDVVAEVASLAQRTFAEHGIETTITSPEDPDSLELRGADGQRYPLHNLLLLCRDETPRRRRVIVEEHVARMARTRDDPIASELDAEALRDRIRTRLIAAVGDDLPIDLSYARPFAPGIVQALCIDYPDTVSTVSAEALPSLAVGVDELYALGQANTDREPVDERREVGPGVELVGGSSLFIASKAANMPAVVGSSPFGTVFAVPHRHLLLVAPLRSTASVAAVEQLAGLAHRIVFGPDPALPGGLLSPYLYFSRGGRVSRVSEIDLEDGSVTISAAGDFADALAELGVGPGSGSGPGPGSGPGLA